MDGVAASGAESGDGFVDRAGDRCIPVTDTEKYETISQFISRNPGIAATDPNTEALKLLEEEMETTFKRNLIESIEK